MAQSGKTTRYLTATGPAGEEVAVPVATIRGAAAGPTMLVVAGVHGAEYVDIEACKRFFGTVTPEALRGQFAYVASPATPLGNPTALKPSLAGRAPVPPT